SDSVPELLRRHRTASLAQPGRLVTNSGGSRCKRLRHSRHDAPGDSQEMVSEAGFRVGAGFRRRFAIRTPGAEVIAFRPDENRTPVAPPVLPLPESGIFHARRSYALELDVPHRPRTGGMVVMGR